MAFKKYQKVEQVEPIKKDEIEPSEKKPKLSSVKTQG